MAISGTGGALDVQGIVSQLMAIERKPLQSLSTQAKQIDTKISAYGKVQSALATFRDAAADLSKASAWRTTRAVNSDPAAVEAIARSGAATASYAVEVQALAQAQTEASGQFSGADAKIGGGSLRIQLGTQTGGPSTFSGDPARVRDIAIPDGATLAQVRDAINAADAGVRASIALDGGQVRLFVTGQGMGGDQAFRIEASATPAAGEIGLDSVASASMSQVKTASDARYTIDGLSLSAKTNRIENALDGVDLVLKKTTSAPAQIELASDTEALRASATKFVEAYNALNTLLAQQTRYDEASRSAGPLQGERSATSIQTMVRETLRATVSDSSLSRLTDAGITLQRDGSLKLDDKTFTSAALDPAKLEKLFAAAPVGAPEDQKGIAQRLRELGDRLLGADGPVTAATDAWRARKTSNDKRQAAIETRLEDVQKRLTRQYAELDAKLSAMQQTSSALQSQLAGLLKGASE